MIRRMTQISNISASLKALSHPRYLSSETENTNDIEMMKKFEEWMAKHEKVYENDAEKEMRFNLFKKNVEYIDAYNKDGDKSVTLGLNYSSDWTPEEFESRRMPVDLRRMLSNPLWLHDLVVDILMEEGGEAQNWMKKMMDKGAPVDKSEKLMVEKFGKERLEKLMKKRGQVGELMEEGGQE